MRWSLIALSVAAFVVGGNLSPAAADQTPFALVGSTNQVAVERRAFGDVLTVISLNTRIRDDSRVYAVDVEILPGDTVETTFSMVVPLPSLATPTHVAAAHCEGAGISEDPVCLGVRAINGCTYSNLPSISKTALSTLLGPCVKTCQTALSVTIGGEPVVFYQWSCAPQGTARCVILAGMEGRIDLIRQIGGCQF